MIRHTVTIRVITPKAAGELLEHNLFEDQRKVRKAHVDFLQTAIEEGKFDAGSPIRLAKVGKDPHILIDAQHRLRAISEMPNGFEIAMPVVVSHCDNYEEVAETYSRIDRGMGRSLVDALRALGQFHESNGLTHTQAATVLACAPLFEVHLRAINITGSNYSSKSAEHRAEVMAPWMEASRQFYATVSRANFGNERLFWNRQIAVVGIASFAFPESAIRATEFWGKMAADDGLEALDPRKKCLEFIRNQTTGESKLRRGTGTSNTINYLSHGVTMCWNAFYRGDMHLSRVLVRDPRGPLNILGTMYAKRDAREIPFVILKPEEGEKAQKEIPLGVLIKSVKRPADQQAAA